MTTCPCHQLSSSSSSQQQSMKMSLVEEQLAAMQLQESRLCYSRQEDSILPSNNSSEDDDTNGFDLRLYLEWRSAMIGWHMNIAQTCHFDLSTVEVATYLVDQYVRRRPEIATQARDFQMLSMACLYLSAKTQEDHCLTPQQLEKLSAGRFVADEIVSMELDILMTLKWQINPPTASSYVRLLLLEDERLNIYSRRRLQQLVDSHIEVALVSNRLIGVDAYRLAVAALRMALCCSTEGGDDSCSYYYSKNLDPDTQVVDDLQAIIIEALCVSPESHQVLWEAYQSVLVETSTDDDDDDDDQTASSKDSHNSNLTPTKSTTTTIKICNPSSPRTTISATSSEPSSEQKQRLLSTMKAVTC